MIKGFDMSALAYIYEHGDKYFDSGKEENAISILKKHGANLIRLRLFNNPYSLYGKEYGAGQCDLMHLKQNVKYCKENNIDYLLDFFYSDCWADPGKQFMPKEWTSLSLDELEKHIYEFTFNTLNSLEYKPSIVEIGNEITNGMLWPIGHVDNFDNLVRLVNAGIQAVNDFDMNIKTMIHLDNGTNNDLYHNWFDNYYKFNGINFDYIGMSYYPFWNGTIQELENNIKDIIKTYRKRVIITETSYPFTLEDYKEDIPEDERIKSPIKGEAISKYIFGISKEAQSKYIKCIAKIVNKIDYLDGFIYWGSELIPSKGSFWATYEGISYMNGTPLIGNEWANQAVFDYEGNSLKILDTIKNL